MIEQSDGLESKAYYAARVAIQSYAHGLLTEEVLAEQMLREWEARRIGDDEPPQKFFKRLAQRICSRALYEAWRSDDVDIRNCAYRNLRNYLTYLLLHGPYRARLEHFAQEEVLHQTLEILISSSGKELNDPAAFLGWTKTILSRHTRVFLDKDHRVNDPCVPLESFTETESEQLSTESQGNPLGYVVSHELQKTVQDAILSLPNPHYQKVLVGLYLAGIDEKDLAQQLGVDIQTIYQWRRRAINALRSKPKLMQALRALLEW